jgi:hypothetical protein
MACTQDGAQPTTSTPAATLPAINYTVVAGAELGDGRHTIMRRPEAPTCLFYARVENNGDRRMLAVSHSAIAAQQQGYAWANLVLEETPGANTCPTRHPATGFPMLKLRSPVTFGAQGYSFELTNGVKCVGQLGAFNCTGA